jgi:formylmethanofuran dehydrogenase subunit B
VAEIALCSQPTTGPGRDPQVSIRIAAAGVDAAGTAHRLDGVPLTLQAPLAGDAPTAAELLRRMLAEVAR